MTIQAARATESHACYPQAFSLKQSSGAGELYLRDPSARKLVEFFETKGLSAVKDEDRREVWYADWLMYQAEHRLYATVLAPAKFDLLRYSRFVELFAYFSAAHAYSMQCTFLGLFPILMSSNEALKKEAIAALDRGELFALGVSEKDHGADLLGNEFIVRDEEPDENSNGKPSPSGSGNLIASGAKYYIGNSNCAAMISILARKEDGRAAGRERRAPFVLFALRPKKSKAFLNNRKIETLGVRAAFVGEFEVKDHPLPAADVISEGRDAWDAVFGTVSLGKFFLGFGAIGICEHAFAEAAQHLNARILYGHPVIAMPHIEATSAQAYARLTAMKLYAYRALDYVHAASAEDRRYLLFTAVQKARVSTEGVKVMALLSECVGAKGFESDTYFEMAIRDAQLIPGLEGSMHINLALAARFILRYCDRPDGTLVNPKSLQHNDASDGANGYLTEARSGAIGTITFPPFLRAYESLRGVLNVRLFIRQAEAFSRFIHGHGADSTFTAIMDDTETALAVAQCMATITYAQLIAENATLFNIAPQMISAIFHSLVADLSVSALTLASVRRLDTPRRVLARRLIAVPRTTALEWGFVSEAVKKLQQT